MPADAIASITIATRGEITIEKQSSRQPSQDASSAHHRERERGTLSGDAALS
jgi:hypothetical protein